ncbi:helicase C-terminal domain-containing protein [Methanobrevibacter sp.]|uniref:helicase C-terminal domain-containing protein n=1 Tax=Methanobrevibacter sp. TaxID=66852 RepID=UPI003864F477
MAERHFPFKSPRTDQLETISEIIDAISRGYKYIVLEAGTGTGKSAIAATLSSIYDSSYILTVTKQLQDQYLEDFTNLCLVKGRGNFRCRMDLTLLCDEGKCIAGTESCENPKTDCDYYIQKHRALNSNTVISNYHYMFLELNYVGDFKKRQLLICDEAHNLENVIMSQLKLEFSVSDLSNYLKLDITDGMLYELENGDYDVWLMFIHEVKEKYLTELERIKDVQKPQLTEKIAFIKREISDCNRFIENIAYDPYSWVFDYNPDYEILEFKPLKVDNYAKNTLLEYGEVCIFMSATILDWKFFSKCLGIREDEIYAIRRKSPFNLKRNPVISVGEYNLSRKFINENAPKTVDVIKSILEKHKDDKGIIHTVSTSCKDFLIDNLNDPRLMEHNTQNRADQLEKFKSTKEPLVLVSPSMNEGVDLPGDLCRFQIIYKLPYPDLGDRQIMMRANADEEWYDYKTSLALVQTYGRGMRFEDDRCVTYFIDSRISSYVENDRFLPDSFKYLFRQNNFDD